MPARKRIIEDVNDHGDVANAMKAKRTSMGTKGNYNSKISHYIKWAERHTPLCIVNNEVTLPMNKESVLSFFGHICSPAYERLNISDPLDVLEDADDPYSVSHIKGYRSAFVNLYTVQNMKIDDELNAEINQVLEGYAKTINELKKCLEIGV